MAMIGGGDSDYLKSARLEGMNRLTAFMHMIPLLADKPEAIAAGINASIQGDNQNIDESMKFNQLARMRMRPGAAGSGDVTDPRFFNPYHVGSTVFA